MKEGKEGVGMKGYGGEGARGSDPTSSSTPTKATSRANTDSSPPSGSAAAAAAAACGSSPFPPQSPFRGLTFDDAEADTFFLFSSLMGDFQELYMQAYDADRRGLWGAMQRLRALLTARNVKLAKKLVRSAPSVTLLSLSSPLSVLSFSSSLSVSFLSFFIFHLSLSFSLLLSFRVPFSGLFFFSCFPSFNSIPHDAGRTRYRTALLRSSMAHHSPVARSGTGRDLQSVGLRVLGGSRGGQGGFCRSLLCGCAHRKESESGDPGGGFWIGDAASDGKEVTR